MIKCSNTMNLFVSIRSDFMDEVVEKFEIDDYIVIHANSPEKKVEEILKNVA